MDETEESGFYPVECVPRDAMHGRCENCANVARFYVTPDDVWFCDVCIDRDIARVALAHALLDALDAFNRRVDIDATATPACAVDLQDVYFLADLCLPPASR